MSPVRPQAIGRRNGGTGARRAGVAALALCAAGLPASCGGGDEILGPLYTVFARTGDFEWDLPPGFPQPRVPGDNPMTVEKVELGRRLFYDIRLSENQTQSCATCHRQELAFTDGLPRGVGSTGEVHPRASMSLTNIGYQPVLTWANPNLTALAAQALLPMFGEDPVELGMSGREDELIERLEADPVYRELFPAAYPDDPVVNLSNITRALASFQRALISGNSRFDQAQRGEITLTESERLGQNLFFGERLECFHCHGGLMFTGTIDFAGKSAPESEFHNTGLYNVDGNGGYPSPNFGLFEFTRRPEDMGKFKAPTLRNIALTAPYMHDGSIATLDDVLDHYSGGGRLITEGPNAGNGRANPNKSEFVIGFELTDRERQALLEFLAALTDRDFVTNPAFSDPWVEGTDGR